MNEETQQQVRVRIAPSPTGNLHVGTARAALFNELFARNRKGVFIVRIEDTDKKRSRIEYEQNIIEGLLWLGLEWQEGIDKGGKYGPYRQSERTSTYTEALEYLLQKDRAYVCTCDQTLDSKPVCACGEKKGELVSNAGTFPIKLRVQAQPISFIDQVRGEVVVHTDTFGGDFIIARSMENPLYHLAVVVDDKLMEITHVIRGEDHLSNTAKHILIQQALEYPQPIYAHLPLLLDEQRRKLSKRNSETSLLVYRDLGILPEAMLNYLALLGWNAGDDQEFFSHAELIEKFSLPRVQKSGAIFSLTKLKSMNKYYIRLLSTEDLAAAAKPFIEKAGLIIQDENLFLKALAVEKDRIELLSEIPALIELFLPNWKAEYDKALLIWKKSDEDTTRLYLQKIIEKISSLSEDDFSVERLQDMFISWIDGEALGRGDVLWPMRVALTGKEYSPSPFEVASVIGKEQAIKRLEVALQKMTL